ncbi:hypothetical protein EVG20_g8192 [Dentipellis fragilis]|uniref:PX domain-containing protein n=1 Tax=Dentipellis fragilis TaxID=205917 RepID=A0A4Y9Y735_9AGAM|nr:hypothetical protein EVG20_g8192 [Dentipellis fragilis]
MPISSPKGWQGEDEGGGGDNDKPLRPRLITSEPLRRRRTVIQPTFVITVDDPQKVGDPIRGYIMYTIHTRTTSPLYSNSMFSDLRRYSDSLWLYETLSANNVGVVVPPVPEKSLFDRLKDQFEQQRQMVLETCITKTAHHLVLLKHVDPKLFLEGDSFSLCASRAPGLEIAQERGSGGLMYNLGLTGLTQTYVETDGVGVRYRIHCKLIRLWAHSHSGSTAKSHTSTPWRLSSATSSKPLRSFPSTEEAEPRASDARLDFDNTPKLVESELAQFEKERIEDSQKSLEKFLDGMIAGQKALIVAREGFQKELLAPNTYTFRYSDWLPVTRQRQTDNLIGSRVGGKRRPGIRVAIPESAELPNSVFESRMWQTCNGTDKGTRYTGGREPQSHPRSRAAAVAVTNR